MDGETMETVRDFLFLGSKITADGDCSQEIKRCLLLGRKAMTNLDSTLKRRDSTLPTKVHLVKAMFFPQSSMDVSKERWLHGRRRAERSYPRLKVRRGGHEEIRLIQGKEQPYGCWRSHEEIPHNQGKRNPSKMVGVARGHQRADTLKP